MTAQKNNNPAENTATKFSRLSIQVSLNGLSFCLLDTVANSVVASDEVIFHKELTPFQTLAELKKLLEDNKIQQIGYSEVVVIHRNNLFSLVPRPLFKPDEMANYLKFNAKILANDLIAYDEIEEHDFVNVYVPFVNINNYIYELFGEFIFKHHGTVMVQSLLNEKISSKAPMCYVHISEQQLDITVISNKKLLLFNNFDFTTKEDFLYYLLFTMEQLRLDPEIVQLRLFGDVEEGDHLYSLCYDYVKHIAIFAPSYNAELMTAPDTESIDFTVLNAL